MIGMGQLWTKNYTILVVANLLFFMGFQLVVPILPLYISDLGGSDTIVGIIVAFGTLGGFVIRPVAGRMVDRVGRFPVYFAGAVLCAIAAFSYSFCRMLWPLGIVRTCHAFFMGTFTTAGSTMAVDSVPSSRINEGIGYYGLSSTIAMAVSPAIALYLIHIIPFGTIFKMAAGMFVLVILVALSLDRTKFFQVPIAKEKKKENIYEKKAMLPGVLLMFQSAGYAAIAAYFALYATGLGIKKVGSYFTIYAIAMLISRLGVGRLADRKGYAIVLIPGMILNSIAMFFMAVGNSMEIFLISALLFGIGFGGAFPTAMAMAVAEIEPQRRGAANATVMSGFDLGFAIGALLWGTVSGMVGYKTMYALNIPFMLIPLAIYLVYLRRRGRGPVYVNSNE